MTTQTDAAVSNTVQNTVGKPPLPDTSLHGKPLVEVLKNLDKSDLKQAYTAMNEAYDIQWGKDGIEEVTAKLQGLQGKVGEKVYTIAKIAMKHCENRLVIARAYFLALCSQAETMKTNWYADKYKEEKPIGQLIPLWSQYKSSIAKGMEKGIDPNMLIEGTDAPKYATAAQYRAAVQVLEKEAKGANERNDGDKTDGQVKTGLSVITSGWSPQLRASMEVMCTAFNGLTHEEQDKFAPKVLDLAAEVTTYKNTAKREAVGDTRTENQRTAGPETTEELDPGTKAAMQAALDETKVGQADAQRIEAEADKRATEQHAKHGKGRKGARAA